MFDRMILALAVFILANLAACSDDDNTTTSPSVTMLPAATQGGASAGESQNARARDPHAASSPVIDRFSAAAATLMVRDPSNNLPGPDVPIDFDQPPFVTRGLGPLGHSVRYYNFDVKSIEPAPIYVLFRAGDSSPVAGQLNIVDVIPGAPGYNDFWQIMRVTVPAGYVANSVTSLDEITSAGLNVASTTMLVNCPIVPAGSTARLRAAPEDTGLVRGWYRGQVVHYFSFTEHPLIGAAVPVAPIYVAFNINPDREGGGPASGFRTEAGSDQTHNVLAGLPNSADYSPLWSVSPYDNAAFDVVRDLATVEVANILARGVATVNCPVVDVEN